MTETKWVLIHGEYHCMPVLTGYSLVTVCETEITDPSNRVYGANLNKVRQSLGGFQLCGKCLAWCDE